MSRSRAVQTALFPLILLILAGCQPGGKQDDASTKFTEIMPGLSYVDSVIGDGPEVQPDDMVTANYTGWLYVDGKKGKKFDSSYDRNEPLTIPLGRSLVIQGWDKGIPGMRVGGKRTLLIGPEMGYGAQGHPPVIPANSTLLFDVEVVGLPKVDVQITHQGDGPEAELGDQISVDYTGYLWEDGQPGKQFDTSQKANGHPYSFTLGAGMVIRGWDMALEGMKKGTKARLIIPPVLGYGAQGHPPVIPPNSTLCFDVELVDIAGK